MQEHKNDNLYKLVRRHVGTARLVSLDALVSTCSTGSPKSSWVESSQVEFGLHYGKSGKEWLKRWVFRRLHKTRRDDADVTWRRSSFQTRAAATRKTRSPTVDNRVRRTMMIMMLREEDLEPRSTLQIDWFPNLVVYEIVDIGVKISFYLSCFQWLINDVVVIVVIPYLYLTLKLNHEALIWQKTFHLPWPNQLLTSFAK